jgi:peptidoglycan-associated lipoprotein
MFNRSAFDKVVSKNVPTVVSVSALSIILALSFTSCSKSKTRSKGFGSDGQLALTPEEQALVDERSLIADQESRYGEGSIPSAESGGIFRDVYFDYDSASLSPEALQDVDANAQILNQDQSLQIQIEGHCDQRGTEDYNLALGESRSKAVKDALIAKGISPNRIQTISFGENVPVDANPSELAFAKNRRAHLAVATSAGSIASSEQNNTYIPETTSDSQQEVARPTNEYNPEIIDPSTSF